MCSMHPVAQRTRQGEESRGERWILCDNLAGRSSACLQCEETKTTPKIAKPKDSPVNRNIDR